MEFYLKKKKLDIGTLSTCSISLKPNKPNIWCQVSTHHKPTHKQGKCCYYLTNHQITGLTAENNIWKFTFQLNSNIKTFKLRINHWMTGEVKKDKEVLQTKYTFVMNWLYYNCFLYYSHNNCDHWVVLLQHPPSSVAYDDPCTAAMEAQPAATTEWNRWSG